MEITEICLQVVATPYLVRVKITKTEMIVPITELIIPKNNKPGLKQVKTANNASMKPK